MWHLYVSQDPQPSRSGRRMACDLPSESTSKGKKAQLGSDVLSCNRQRGYASHLVVPTRRSSIAVLSARNSAHWLNSTRKLRCRRPKQPPKPHSSDQKTLRHTRALIALRLHSPPEPEPMPHRTSMRRCSSIKEPARSRVSRGQRASLGRRDGPQHGTLPFEAELQGSCETVREAASRPRTNPRARDRSSRSSWRLGW